MEGVIHMPWPFQLLSHLVNSNYSHWLQAGSAGVSRTGTEAGIEAVGGDRRGSAGWWMGSTACSLTAWLRSSSCPGACSAGCVRPGQGHLKVVRAPTPRPFSPVVQMRKKVLQRGARQDSPSLGRQRWALGNQGVLGLAIYSLFSFVSSPY